MRKFTGWSVKGKKFTQQQFNNSALKDSGMTYMRYKVAFDQQSKIPRLRRSL